MAMKIRSRRGPSTLVGWIIDSYSLSNAFAMTFHRFYVDKHACNCYIIMRSLELLAKGMSVIRVYNQALWQSCFRWVWDWRLISIVCQCKLLLSSFPLHDTLSYISWRYHRHSFDLDTFILIEKWMVVAQLTAYPMDMIANHLFTEMRKFYISESSEFI